MLLESENIKLRAPEPEDLEALYRWENDPVLWPSGCTIAPCSRYDLKQYIASPKDLYESCQLRLMIDLKPDFKTVGTIDLYDFEPHHRRAATGMMVDREYQRRGIAGNALSILCRYAFSFLRLHQLYAFIPADNEPSRRLFNRYGFTERGRLSGWLQTEEGYKDVLLVSLISDL
ncbi:MAG: GNAT family N-acetyltransferase [Tannerella sp.]|jgi:diamine N-acetyltransferase|nr:GNAT family N-acetyltransferase [Tannerella sp.]